MNNNTKTGIIKHLQQKGMNSENVKETILAIIKSHNKYGIHGKDF